MKKWPFAISGLLSISAVSLAQWTTPTIVFPDTWIAGYSQQQNNICASLGNPATAPHQKKYDAALLAERRYSLKELSIYQAILSLTVNPGYFTLSGYYRGFSGYNTSQLGIAYGRDLTDGISVALRFTFNRVKIQGYGQRSAPGMEWGTRLHLGHGIQAGFRLANPASMFNTKRRPGKLPMTMNFGIGCDASPQFFTGLVVKKTEGGPGILYLGVQYRPDPKISMHLTLVANTGMVAVSVSFQFKQYALYISASCQPPLGISPGVIVMFSSPDL